MKFCPQLIVKRQEKRKPNVKMIATKDYKDWPKVAIIMCRGVIT